jgi:hypothetical protein
MTRRQALRGIVAGAVTAAAGGALLAGEDVEAKRSRKNKKGKNRKGRQNTGGQNLPPGARCQNSEQCTPSYICEVPVNGSNSDTYCCGAQGAGCGAKNEDGDDTAPYCCVGHACVYHPNNGSWTCEAVV